MLISMGTYTCPDCSSEIDHSKRRGVVTFFCEACGYSHRGDAGYSVDEVYFSISKKKYSEKQPVPKEKSQGFVTKNSNKNHFSNKRKLLKSDPIIEANVLSTSKTVSEEHPETIQKFNRDKSFSFVHYKKLPENKPSTGKPLNKILKIPGLINDLEAKGIFHLYDYQEKAYESISSGHNTIITAPTGLGKTEAFLLPIMESIFYSEPNPLKRRGPFAIFIYPTKALAKDQLDKIRNYGYKSGIRTGIYDGDTPLSDRDQIFLDPPDILITNPDMIHWHLRSNFSFQGLIKRIKYLVIDEIHLCVGSFGSNILWLIRRLKRFTNDLQLIGSSATISNAKEFAETLFETKVHHILLSDVRKSEMHLSMIYPKETSNLSTLARIVEYMIKDGNKTIAFGNSHITAESLNLILQRNGINSNIHRGGLSISHRNRVEEDFKNNNIDALVATPTLELGIDIGDLDSVVTSLTGITNFVQRIGRAGRQGQESFATLVLRGDDPISAYFARHPEDYLEEIDPAYVEPNNEIVAEYQLLTMALEMPISDEEYYKYKRFVDKLIDKRLLFYDYKGIIVKDRRKVADILKKYSIRGIGENVKILHNRKVIGDRALPMALRELHPGAFYLHAGRTYEVQNFRDYTKEAMLSQTLEKGIRTQAERSMWPNIVEIDYETNINGLDSAYLTLELTETVTGYQKFDLFTNKKLSTHLLDDELEYTFETKGFAIHLPEPVNRIDNKAQTEIENILNGTFHAIEHVLIESGNSLTGGGANQIGGLSMGDSGLIFVYDGNAGGSGLSKLLFDRMDKGLKRALKILEECPCNRIDGCPRCTYSYQCGNNNEPLDRIGAIDSLKQFGKISTELNLEYEGIQTFIKSGIQVDNSFSPYSDDFLISLMKKIQD
jgi:DEAD/DEAH box helicase domain-containing protein